MSRKRQLKQGTISHDIGSSLIIFFKFFFIVIIPTCLIGLVEFDY
jgi:hypothetical protein